MFPVIIHDGQTPFPKDDIFYVVSKEGIFLRKRLGIMDSIAPVKNISILNSIQTAATMHIKKIPAKQSQEIINFFKWVYEEYSSEAIVLLFYNIEKKVYHIEAPVQEVSGASLDYNKAISIDGYEMIGTIHSHANMSAFHSGVDDADEASFDGLHITFGNMKDEEISISASIVANAHRVMVDPEEYMNNVIRTIDVDEEVQVPYANTYVWDKEQKKMIPSTNSSRTYTRKRFDRRFIIQLSKNPGFPKSWMENVTKKTYSTYKTGGGRWWDYGYGMVYGESDYWKDWQGHNTGNSAVKPGRETPGRMTMSKETPGQPHGIITDSRKEKPQPTPCDACKFKSNKLNMMLDNLTTEAKKVIIAWALDELENEEVIKLASVLGDDYQDRSYYLCENCDQPFSCIETGDKTAGCPICKTDESLIEIEAADMVELLQADEEDEGNLLSTKIQCPACASTFTRDFLNDGACPMCGTNIDDIPEYIDCPNCGERHPLATIMCDSQCESCGMDIVSHEELTHLWTKIGVKPMDTVLHPTVKSSEDNILEDQKAMDAVAESDKRLKRIPTPDKIGSKQHGKGRGFLGSIVNRFSKGK